jgi:hypothetical protein
MELRFPPESSWAYLASRPAEAVSRLLSWASAPFSTCRTWGSTLTRACLTRFVPPSGFRYPLGGLLPPSPRRPYLMPTALLGFHPSEPSPPERYLGCFHPGRTHVPFTCRYSVGRILRAARQAATSGLRPFQESLAGPVRLTQADSRLLPWASTPSRVSHRTPDPRSLAGSSLALDPSSSLRRRNDPCLRVSISARLARRSASRQAERRNRATLLGFLHRSTPAAQTEDSPGYGFTSQVSRHL